MIRIDIHYLYTDINLSRDTYILPRPSTVRPTRHVKK
jgi:hypothetical protein